MVSNFGMEVAHLGVLLHAERVVGVAPNRESKFINRDNPVSGGTFEHMQLAHTLLRRRDQFKLRETHLKHHIRLQTHLRPHHDERACR